MPPGESILGGLKDGIKVIVEDGVAKMPDRTAFAGSVATFDRLVRNMIQLAGVPLSEVIQMAAGTPAKIMKIDDRKGTLEVGKDADIVLFDAEIQIDTTIIDGKIVYNAGV
jgi:N-acetylglucosamine-6-phosphate deacetylase